MPSRYFDNRDRREPDKTPLIDVIFLLLIFFFVAIVGLDLTPKPQAGFKAGGSKKKLDLLAMTNPMEPAPDSLGDNLLLQIGRAADLEETLVFKMNQIIQQAGKFGITRAGLKSEIRREGYVVMVFDQRYPDQLSLKRVTMELESLVDDLKESQSVQLRRRVRDLIQYLPVNLPAKNGPQFDEPGYKNATTYLEHRILAHFSQEAFQGGPRPELHVYMDRTVYVRLLDKLFDICSRVENFDLDHIKFRVLEKKVS